MNTNRAYIQRFAENNRLRKWWRHRWAKTVCISFVVFIILTIAIGLLLKFVILSPGKPDSMRTTTTTTSPATTATTTQQPGEF